MHTITITKAVNGMMVQVGCQMFVFQDEHMDVMLNDLRSYLLDETRTLATYRKRYPKLRDMPVEADGLTAPPPQLNSLYGVGRDIRPEEAESAVSVNYSAQSTQTTSNH